MDQGNTAEERAAKFRRRMVSDIYDQQPQYIEGRFKDWTKQEMILQLVMKGVTIRNEHQVTLKTIRDLMKSYYEGLDTPPKPVSRYNSLTKNIVDRGIILFQNLVFRYLYKIRLYNDGGNNQNLLEQNERDFGDAYAGETEAKYYNKQPGRRQSLGARAAAIQADAEARLTAKERKSLVAGKLALSAFSDILGVKSRGIRSNQFQPPDSDSDSKKGADAKLDFHSTLHRLAQQHISTGGVPSQALVNSEAGQRVMSYLDMEYQAPAWERAKEYAESTRPQRWVRLPGSKADIYEPYSFWKTTTGRHCCAGSYGEQCDVFHEGKLSELSALGPNVTNFFKFVKWLIWLFAVLTVISLVMTIINIYGPLSPLNTYDMRLSDLTMSSIGNLVYGLSGNTSDSFQINVPGCYEGAFTTVDCDMDRNAVGWVYAGTDMAISIVLIIALVWLKKYERKEEVLLDVNLVTVSMYSVMVKNLPPGITEDDLKEYIEAVCDIKGIPDPMVEHVTLGLDKFKTDEADEDEEGLKKMYALEHEIEHAARDVEAAVEGVASSGTKKGFKKVADDDGDADDDLKEAAGGPRSPKKGGYSGIFGGKNYSLKDVIKRGELVLARKRLVQKYRFDVTRLRTGDYGRGTGARAVSTEDIEEKVSMLYDVFCRDIAAINKAITEKDACLSLLVQKQSKAKVAFVTFDSVQAADAVREAFTPTYTETLLGWCGVKAKNKKEDDVYPVWKGKRLRITQAPEPEDVVWENLNVDWWPRMRGRFVTLCIGLVLLALSLTFLVTSKSGLEVAYSGNKAGNMAAAETYAFFAACLIALSSYAFEQSTKWMAQHFEKHHSRDTMEQSIFTRLLFFRLANFILIFLVCNNAWFQQMEPDFDPTVTDDDSEALSLYIIKHAYNPSVVDFDYSWYASVGMILMLVQMITMITSHIGMLQQYRAYHKRLLLAKKHCDIHESIRQKKVDMREADADTIAGGADGNSVRTIDIEMGTVTTAASKSSRQSNQGSRESKMLSKRQKTLEELYNDVVLSRSVEVATAKDPEARFSLTQQDVNERLKGPSFDWPVVYAQLLSSVFVALTFGTGLPMLYAFCLIHFIVSYFTYKFLFLNLYTTPPRNRTAKLSREATALIPLAITIHLIASIWMLSYGALFNNDTDAIKDEDTGRYITFDEIVDRVLNTSHVAALAAFGALLLVVCLGGFLYGRSRLDKNNTYSYLFTVPCTGIFGSGSITSTTVPGSIALDIGFERAVQRNLIKGTNNYNILSNPHYKDKLGVGYDFIARHGYLHQKSFGDGAKGKMLPSKEETLHMNDGGKGDTARSGAYAIPRQNPDHVLNYELGLRMKALAERGYSAPTSPKIGDDLDKYKVDPKELREIVEYVYEQYNPSKIPEIPELIEKFEGREYVMLASLQRKYHVGMDNVETQVYVIYETFNPRKILDVPAILEKYKGSEKKLFEGLRVKYRINMHPVENEMWTLIDKNDPDKRNEIPHMLNDAGGPHTARAMELLKQIRGKYNNGEPMPLSQKANAQLFRYEYYNPFERALNIPTVPHTTNYSRINFDGSVIDSPSAPPANQINRGSVDVPGRMSAAPVGIASAGTHSGGPSDSAFVQLTKGYTAVSKVGPEPQAGKFLLENGHLYEGELRNRVPEGLGKINDPHSILELEGMFVAGKLKGSGRLRTVGGNVYEGEFDDLFHGHGVYKWKDGSEYTGSFVKGKKEGAGSYRGPSGNTYVGSFTADEFDGFGIYTNANNGVVYEGYFKHGRKDGPGKLFSPDGRSRSGLWKDGKEIKGAKLTTEQIQDVTSLGQAAHDAHRSNSEDEGFSPTSEEASSERQASKPSSREGEKAATTPPPPPSGSGGREADMADEEHTDSGDEGGVFVDREGS